MEKEKERSDETNHSALLAALLLLSLAACGEKTDEDTTASTYDDTLITELYSEEGDYTDAPGNEVHYFTMCRSSCRKRRSPPR